MSVAITGAFPVLTRPAAPLYPLENNFDCDEPELKTLAVIGAKRAARGGAKVAPASTSADAFSEASAAASPAPLGWEFDEAWEQEWEQAWRRLTSAAPSHNLLPFAPPSESQRSSLSAAPALPAAPAAVLPPIPAEARGEFQRLHSALLLAAERQGAQALLVSGVGVGDGASFVTRHLSRLLADSGRLRVVRVEVTPRRSPATRGDELFALGETDLPNLYEVAFAPEPAARRPTAPHPPDAPDTFGTFLRRLREHFDFILIDAPAVTAQAETARLGALADGVVLVAREGVTPHRLIEAAYDLFDEERANLLGVVLNRCAPRAPQAALERRAA
jgi:Mrp family chromosome partitioning ATPase